jgi:cold shock protein
MATVTVKSFNATKGFGFIQPTDGGTDVSFTSALSSVAGCVTPTKARRSSYDVVADKRTGKSSAANLKPRDEEFAYPVAPPFN